MWVIAFIITFLLTAIFETQGYKGKVFDYTPKYEPDSAEITMTYNLQSFLSKISTDDDVVVLPEYGLTSKIFTKEHFTKFALEIPKGKNINFCSQTSKYKILTNLSCTAKEYGIYLVANIIESDGILFYNTNLVFNKFGALIATYRKINLDEEESKFLKAGTEIVSFKTDYGEFTTFTGADVVHENPALKALKNNVSNVLYPTAWVAKSPFWSTHSVQDGYAKRTGVNLLASAYSSPRNGTGGCGIYQGRDRKDIKILTLSEMTCVMSEVDRAEIGRPQCLKTKVGDFEGAVTLDIEKLHIMRNALIDAEETVQCDFPRNTNEFQAELCLRKETMCCKFKAVIFNKIIDRDPYYKFLLYSKGSHYGCGIVSCKNNNIESCGRPVSTSKNNKFNMIRVEARHTNSLAYDMPSTLRYNMKPVDYFTYCSKPGNATIELMEKDSIVAFGIIYSNSEKINSVLYIIFFVLIIDFIM